MKVRDYIEDYYPNVVVDVDVFRKGCGWSFARGFHSDYIELIDSLEPHGLDIDLFDEDVVDYEIMNEEDYNFSVYANCGYKADFSDWYGDKNAKILVLLIDD